MNPNSPAPTFTAYSETKVVFQRLDGASRAQMILPEHWDPYGCVHTVQPLHSQQSFGSLKVKSLFTLSWHWSSLGLLGQQCSNPGAMRIIQVHIDHTNSLGHVLGQRGQIHNLENPWQMPSNVSVLWQKASCAPDSMLPHRYHIGLFHSWSRKCTCEHTETHFRAISAVPVSQNPPFDIQKEGLIGSQDVLGLAFLHLRLLYPLAGQTHEVGIYDAQSSQSHLMSDHLHHPKSTIQYWLGSRAATCTWDHFS